MLYPGKDPQTEEPDKSKTGEDKNPDNNWTKHNLSLFRYEFDSKFAITGRTACATEAGYGQVMKAGFTVDFADELKINETFKCVLSSDDGDGDALLLEEQYFIAYDANEKVVDEGVDLTGDPVYNDDANTYSFELSIKKEEVVKVHSYLHHFLQ